jgi:serine O-acetyltransferase
MSELKVQQFESAPTDPVWERIRSETEAELAREPVLASFLHTTILNHDNLEAALSYHLADKLHCPAASSLLLREVIEKSFASCQTIGASIRADLLAVEERDSACDFLFIPFLYFKGFHALEIHRVANCLWNDGRESLALFFQNRVSCEFAIDIHPAAKMGQGIMLDHATGLVIGQTAVVGNNVSILQQVTLGGTGKEHGDRHPKVGDGVMISAGAKILGNIKIGNGAKVGAGSVVLQEVPPHTTVAGVPARVVGKPESDQPALDMNQSFNLDYDI